MERLEVKMRTALYVLGGIIGTMFVVDVVYIFGLVLGEARSGYQRKQRKKYGKEA